MPIAARRKAAGRQPQPLARRRLTMITQGGKKSDWESSDDESSSSDDDGAPPSPKRPRRRRPQSPSLDSSATQRLDNDAAPGAKTENDDFLTYYLSKKELRKLTGPQRDELMALVKVASTQSPFLRCEA